MDNKCYYHRMFSQLDVIMPNIIAYRLNNFWYDSKDDVITFQDVLDKSTQYEESFIKKSVESWGGSGVYYFSQAYGKEKFDSIIGSIGGDLIIQEGIKQSQTLDTINSDFVNTIRVLSFLRTDGSVLILSTILRLGVKGAKVDNASSGGIVVGIKIKR